MHEARAFNFTYRYIDDVLSINNPRFAEFLPLIYPPELEVKETTDTASSASFLDLYLEFDESFNSPAPVACFSDKDDVSGNQNNCYWPLDSESIARCKHHMQEKLVYCCQEKYFTIIFKIIQNNLAVSI
jgi:hypothetical protein